MSIATVILLHGALLSNGYLEEHNVNVVKLNANSAQQLCALVARQSGAVIVAGQSKADPVLQKAASQCGDHINGLVFMNGADKNTVAQHKIFNSIPKFYLNHHDTNIDKQVFEIAEYISESVKTA